MPGAPAPRRLDRALMCAIGALGATALDAHAGPPVCRPGWLGLFAPGEPGANAAAVFDDGRGPALYVAGGFESIGTLRTNRIARWDGARWESLGDGLVNGRDRCRADAMCVFDADGDGPACPMLFVGGEFRAAGGTPVSNVAAWDGVQWRAVPGGVRGNVYALGVFDEDGAGPGAPRLFVGGNGVGADGVSTPTNIIKWDGTAWSGVGAGAGFAGSQSVECFAVFDADGSGPESPELFVGGGFNSIPGNPGNMVARWNGERWADCAGYPGGSVRRLLAFDPDGAGPLHASLIVLGRFQRIYHADGTVVPAGHAAQWDGVSWSTMGGGVTPSNAGSNGISDAAVFDPDGEGPAAAVVVVGGTFNAAGGAPASNLAAWDGAAWFPVGTGLGGMFAYTGCSMLATFDDGQGERLFVSGGFQRAGTLDVDSFAAWDGDEWSRVGPAAGSISGFVHALAMHDDGAGPTLYAGGEFAGASGAPAANVARWDGDRWAALGAGVAAPPDPFNAPVEALLSFDADGPGPTPSELIVGGQFTSAGGAPATLVARWTGESWSAMPGLITGSYQAGVFALASFDEDGEGPAPARIFAGGSFALATGAVGLARWSGSAWERVGNGISGGGGGAVIAVADGPMRGLYARGTVAPAVQTGVDIGRWDGEAWSRVGNSLPGNVEAMCVHDDGSGPTLYVAGSSLRPGGFGPTGDLARLHQGAWELVPTPSTYDLNAVASFDDGSGPAVYVGGRFSWGATTNCFARWDGTRWSSVGLGGTGYYTRERVRALLPVTHAGRPTLFIGGEFPSMGGTSAVGVAAYVGCDEICAGDISGDRRVDSFDLWLALSDFGRLLAQPGAIASDLNLDGVVDFLDLNVVLSSFGIEC